MNNTNKSSKAIKLGGPSTNDDGVAQSAASDGPAEYDYFTPVLSVDVWPTILSYVKQKKDIESALNTCQLFHDILHPRAFTELILPLILLKSNLPSQTVLNCRGINHHTKSTVENVLFHTYPPWFYPGMTYIEDLDNFITKSLPNYPLNLNPFVWKRVTLEAFVPQQLQDILNLTRNYGAKLTQLELYVDVTRVTHNEQLEILRMFLQAFNNISQIKILTLNIRDFPLDGFPFLEPLDGMENGEHQVPAFIFPKLNSLSDLTINFNEILDVLRLNYISPMAYQFMQNMFQTYGPQLDSFSCNNLMFDSGFKANFFSSSLANIKQFTIDMPSIQSFDTVAQFKFPKLERLILTRHHSKKIPFSPFLFRMLENFGDTLMELQFEDFGEIQLDMIALDDLKPLLKLTKLTIYSKSFDTCLWSIFQIILPNLICLKFQPKGRLEETPVPGYNIRQGYFNMFPRLEKLIWCNFSREMNWNEKTYVRNIQLPVCRYYEVPKHGYTINL
ncbi:unnamed protein product [Orchesella dallaii]|uniref:F-box domain-containing protein n=1 Tax=Orchesella dallaii TaxID=48710 RepID=A0ABP1PPG3_9HEXA